MDCVPENQNYISKTNKFKIQMEELLEQFRLFTFKDQLKLLSDVRRFFLEVENICNAISHHAHHHHDVDKVLHSEFLPIGSYACDVISTSLQGDHAGVDGKLTSSSITAHGDIIQEDDEVPVDGASDQATLEETDIRQIADYLLGFSKLTVGAICNSNDHQIIMNPDSTSLLELQSPACVQIRGATAETDHQHHDLHALEADASVDDMACKENCSRIESERKDIYNDDETKNQSVHESADGSRMASTSPRQLRKRPEPQCGIAHRATLPPSREESGSSSGALSCVKCRSLFENVEQLSQHSCDHRDQIDVINGCKVDDHIAASTLARRRSALRRHVKRRNVANLARRLYECDRCERKFVKRPSLFSHQREHAGPNEVVCLKCGVTSTDAEQHAVHVQKHVERAPFRCDTCGESFARRQQYDRHTAGHRLYDCTDCDGDHVAHFSTAKQVARHRRLVHGAVHTMEKKQRHECLVCQRTFVRRRQLELHQRRSHSTDVAVAAKSRTKCSFCSKSFRTQSALVEHLVIAHQQQQQQIATSDGRESSSAIDPAAIAVKRFSSTEEEVQAVVAKVRRQTTSITLEACQGADNDEAGSRRRPRQDKPTVRRKENRDAGFLCSVCGATFLRKQCLVRHNRQQHDGGILYECDFCDYRCNCKANLKRHVELHVNERRRFVCELCAASFHALATLKEHHAYVHCEERRHACSECGKSFKSKSALQRHARIHNDRRPYVCTQCTQAYKRMSHLKRHMATVHGAFFESKRVRRLRGERESLTLSAPHPLPPPTYVVQHQQLTSNVIDSDVRIDMMTAPSNNNNNNNNDFLMSIGVDEHVAKTSQLLDSVPIGQCLQPLPPMTDIVPSAGGPLPSMPRRLLHHHAFLDVDYTSAACQANVLHPIDVLQSDLTANSGSIDGASKISDMFW